MSERANAEPGQNRLIDIEVEEVSLVDRAANKHRFLIVKRSQEMDEDSTTTTEEMREDLDTEDDEPGDWLEAGEDETAPEETGAGADSTSEDTVLGTAIAALEGLTETVERLGTQGDADGARLAELAGELRGVSERLASTSATSGKGRQEMQASANAVPAALGKQLAEFTSALRSLNKMVTAQQQRLTRLEKHFGMPNSRPTGEQGTRPGGNPGGGNDDDVGWPLDMNNPFDRENVDKALSFHEV